MAQGQPKQRFSASHYNYYYIIIIISNKNINIYITTDNIFIIHAINYK